MKRLSSGGFGLFCILLVMLLAGWLYWPTLQFPLIYDTLLHIRIAGGLTMGSVWLPTEAFGFYRPMTFFPMLLIQELFDGYPAWLLHGNNVVQHAANAGLLAWLSWRLWPDWRRAVAGGAIFATFPFAYQAVTVYGHNVHPAIVGLVLLGLHSYLTAVSHQSPRKWWGLTSFLFVVMLLTHETAVLFGWFALLVQINAQPEAIKRWLGLVRQKEWRTLQRLPWLWFLLAGLLYLIIYQLLPISRAPQTAALGQNLWLNWLYVLQAAVFSLTWFAHLLPNMSGAAITLVSGGLVVALSGWLAWRRPTWRHPLLLAWGWWAAPSLLIGVTLPTDYLLRGPRLLYLGGVGVALLWAHLLAWVWHGRSATYSWLKSVAWTAVLSFILITSGQFVDTKLDEYAQLTQPVSVMQSALHPRITPPNAEIVLVNLPQWLDVPPNTYAVGVEFVAMLGGYLFVNELVSANLPEPHRVWAVSLPELQTSQRYAYGIHGQHSWPAPATTLQRHIFITQFAPEQPQMQHMGYVVPETGLATPDSIAQFENYNLSEAAASACDGTVNIGLHWQPNASSVPDTTAIFVQVLDANGRLLAQADGPPLGVRPGLLGATPDWLLVDLRKIELAKEETAVPTTVLVGVYDFTTGERSPATDNSGQPLPDNAWETPISPCPDR